MQADIAIVVIGYNRPRSLERILRSLGEARYDPYQHISLFISIDGSGYAECSTIAQEFKWGHGPKNVILHPIRKGLKEHVLSCGDLSANFDGVIILEDDLYLSPEFYQYSQQAFRFFKDEEYIAGIALYHPLFNETACCPFDPVHDGYDNYFMQIPCSWGQLWTRDQWKKFREYLNSPFSEDNIAPLPKNVRIWPEKTSWKKLFYTYLLNRQLYFVYPRISLSTNFGESGQHLISHQSAFQTPLLLGPRDFKFSSLSESSSIYDGFYEIDCCMYHKYLHENISVTIDLNGTKSINEIQTEYLISSKKAQHPLKKYSISLYPYELNILKDIPPPIGATAFFTLARTKDFKDDSQFFRINEDLNRLFLSVDFIKDAAIGDLKKMREYRIGAFLLNPFRFLKQLLKREHEQNQ